MPFRLIIQIFLAINFFLNLENRFTKLCNIFKESTFFRDDIKIQIRLLHYAKHKLLLLAFSRTKYRFCFIQVLNPYKWQSIVLGPFVICEIFILKKIYLLGILTVVWTKNCFFLILILFSHMTYDISTNHLYYS